ncbi:hypothetical protein I4U23_015464 [Adineta vaga]|nr:hypothetical protein I4U23_015464 [Adineta vaga]
MSVRTLPLHDINSVFAIATYWMISIRIIHFTVLSVDKSHTLLSFVKKCLWILFPVVRYPSKEGEWPVLYYLISGVAKFVLNRWIHKWLLMCEANDSYIRVMVYFLSILSFSYVIDFETFVIRIVTRDKYTMQPLNNFPFLSQSVREFWGRRYNQIIGTILKESVFQPLSLYISSPSIRALITFTISGIFHAHIVFVVFNDPSSVSSSIACFVLNGIAGCIETRLPIKFPLQLRYLMTYSILFVTAPMCLGPYARDKAVFFGVDSLSSYGDQWISKLPVPKMCPRGEQY